MVLQNANATALPRAYDTKVLRRRMERYVAKGVLAREVREVSDAIEKVGGKRYRQPWTDALTVGRWESIRVQGRRAVVVFIGYDTGSLSRNDRYDAPLQRTTVNMVWEDHRWKLESTRSSWLTPEGPMEQPGSKEIEQLPERDVFSNPRP